MPVPDQREQRVNPTLEESKLQHNSRKCSRTPSCMGKIVTAFLFFILFFRVTVYSLTFNTSMTLSLEREFPHDTVDLTQLHLLDTARHIRFKVPQFGVGGNADRHIAGLYFTSVRLGTPPKEYILQIDTGSSLTWIYCTGCVGCSTRNLLRAPHDFNPKNSITSSEVDCTAQVCSLVHKILGGECLKSNWCSFDAMYGGGALASMLSGYLLTDQMKLAATLENASKIISSVPITFGYAILPFTLNFLV
ncbi:Xylanase inhibitor, N-terminal [Dillenia turbinata]|uniref:Xylanase inhibitor, N-terminal n=1 Tax=Dillenia turbinata TaxID=194707 RepID=A0AAN8ZAW5_9MAGN